MPIDAAKRRVITPDGKQLPIEEVWKRLKKDTVVVASADGATPAQAYLRALNPETLIIIGPPLERIVAPSPPKDGPKLPPPLPPKNWSVGGFQMFTLSAFADEIDPDPLKQIEVLKSCGVRHIEFRSIHATNVLNLSDAQIADFKALLDKNGFKLSAIGSPIGKIKIDEPFEPHLERFKRAIHLCGVFGVKNIRVFSYYPPDNFAGDWTKWRPEVMSRMTRKCELAAKADVRLIHENEHRIYGDSPERVTDLMTTLRKTFGADVIGAVHDPANFVFCGYDPWQGWLSSKPWLVHFHIKDWISGQAHGSLAGEGQGRVPEVIADAVKIGYSGFATLEPHLLGGGPTGGVTGPELFPKTVAAFKIILDNAGAKYQ